MQFIIITIMSFLKKYWLYIVGGLGIIVLYKKIFVGNKVNHITTQYDLLGVSISKNQALAYAQRLYTAMEGVGTETDVLDTIYNILKNNPNDVKAVYNAFGTKNYGLFGSPQWWVSNTSGDLKDWLKWELSGKRLNDWNTLLQSANII